MSIHRRCRPQDLPRLIAEDLKQLKDRVDAAWKATADESVPIIRRRAPRAFGDLSNSVHVVPGKTVVDAPHAAAVEIGSLPHEPDMEKLIAWVKLRGLQGLHQRGRLRSLGPTTPYQAMRVAEMLRREVMRGPGGEFSPIDSPEKVAAAIAAAIRARGTKPHWFVRSSLPDIHIVLDRLVRAAVKQ